MGRKGSWFPARIRCMALLALFRDIDYIMIGIACLVEILGMASKTIVRCINIVSVMTAKTIVTDRCMGTCKWVIFRMVRKQSRYPARLRSMTLCTIVINPGCNMIGVACLVEFCFMAVAAKCCGAGISISMAFNTGCINMGPCQGKRVRL